MILIRRSQQWIPISVIMILPLILFWPLVFGGRVLYWGTPLLQFYPWRKLAVDMVRSGHVPLWNHYLGNGTPLAANLQSAAFYPLNLIYLVFPVERAMGYSAVLHVILAGLFMYLYGRTIQLSRFASLVAALSYMFSGFLISRLGFLSMTSATPWLPLLFCLAERLVSQRRLDNALLLGLTIGLQFLAGHAQLWYYGLWALAAYGLARSWQVATISSQGGEFRGFPERLPCTLRLATRAWLLLALAVLVGLGVAAVQLLPTAELALLSQRQGGAEYEFAMTYSFWPWRLITLFAPDFFGNPARGDYWGYATYWEDCGYIGVLPLILALLAISIYLGQKIRPRTTLHPSPFTLHASRFTLHASLVPFFSLLCLLSLLLALGKNLPLYPLVFRRVPGFSFFQAPARFLYLYTLGMAALAGLGAELVKPSRRLERISGYGVVVGLAILLATAAIKLLPLPPVKLTFVSASARLAVLLIIASLLLLCQRKAEFRTGRTYRPGISPPVLWQALVIAFIAADLILFGHALNPTTDSRLYELPTTVGAFLRREDERDRIFTFSGTEYDLKFKKYLHFDDFGPRDTSWLTGLRETLLPNLAMREELFSANNFDPLLVGYYERLMQEVDKGLPRQAGEARLVIALRLLSLMNVKYILDDGEVPGLNLIFADGIRIYRNDEALPRAYVVFQSQMVSDDEALLTELLSPTFDPRHVVLLSPAPGQEPISHPHPLVSLSPVSPIPLSPEYSPNAVKIKVALDRDGYLVLSDTCYPGWRVYVDGEEREILRANYAFRAVLLESGQHTVLFKYDPLSFKIGLAISLATWGAILPGLATLGFQRPRRGQKSGN